VFPEPEVKSFLELCQEALEDPTMIILVVAAVVSLLIGIVKGWPSPMHECYEGIAILCAVSTPLPPSVPRRGRKRREQTPDDVTGRRFGSTLTPCRAWFDRWSS
jgi:hypothetical protein